MKNSIEFTCWEVDTPLEIQLEPEALIYTINPGDTAKFAPINPSDDFTWNIRVGNEPRLLQLFPDDSSAYEGIEVFLNSDLIDRIL